MLVCQVALFSFFAEEEWVVLHHERVRSQQAEATLVTDFQDVDILRLDGDI
jgi:hypothetical protein